LPTSGGRSVGIVHSRSKATNISFFATVMKCDNFCHITLCILSKVRALLVKYFILVSFLLFTFYATKFSSSWRRNIPPKRLLTSNRQHDVAIQKVRHSVCQVSKGKETSYVVDIQPRLSCFSPLCGLNEWGGGYVTAIGSLTPSAVIPESDTYARWRPVSSARHASHNKPTPRAHRPN
jgi:hypothetical protein